MGGDHHIFLKNGSIIFAAEQLNRPNRLNRLANPVFRRNDLASRERAAVAEMRTDLPAVGQISWPCCVDLGETDSPKAGKSMFEIV